MDDFEGDIAGVTACPLSSAQIGGNEECSVVLGVKTVRRDLASHLDQSARADTAPNCGNLDNVHRGHVYAIEFPLTAVRLWNVFNYCEC